MSSLPHGDEAIDVGMVEHEDRIKGRPTQVSHMTHGAAASNVDVNVVVRALEVVSSLAVGDHFSIGTSPSEDIVLGVVSGWLCSVVIYTGY